MFELQLEGVTHRYSRRREPSLSEVSLTLGGGIVGLVGPNGAGKTTLLKLLLGLLDPVAGEIRICGDAPAEFRRHQGLGFIPERASFPAHLTVREFLTAARALLGPHPLEAGEKGNDGEPRLERWMELRELEGYRLGELSLGQTRRVEVAVALLGDPPLLLLDEPTNGLDPVALTQFRKLILEARREGRLILVSSHHLDELQRLADRVVVMDRGRCIGSWSADEVRVRSGSFQEHFLELVSANES